MPPDDHPTAGPLSDRVVVVSVREPDAAVALAGAGARVVVVGTDAAETGGLVRRLREAGHRAHAFVGDATRDASALAEMIDELFPERAPGTPEPA